MVLTIFGVISTFSKFCLQSKFVRRWNLFGGPSLVVHEHFRFDDVWSRPACTEVPDLDIRAPDAFVTLIWFTSKCDKKSNSTDSSIRVSLMLQDPPKITDTSFSHLSCFLRNIFCHATGTSYFLHSVPSLTLLKSEAAQSHTETRTWLWSGQRAWNETVRGWSHFDRSRCAHVTEAGGVENQDREQANNTNRQINCLGKKSNRVLLSRLFCNFSSFGGELRPPVLALTIQSISGKALQCTVNMVHASLKTPSIPKPPYVNYNLAIWPANWLPRRPIFDKLGSPLLSL